MGDLVQRWNKVGVMSTKPAISLNRTTVTMTDYSKWHTRFRIGTKTLNGRNVTLAEIKKFYGVHQKNLNEDRSTLSAAKCMPMILVSRNTRYMRIFTGVPRGGASNTISVMRPNFEQVHVLLVINRHCAFASRATGYVQSQTSDQPDLLKFVQN